MSLVTLRPLEASDADLLFRWRNDPFIVARGSSQRTVTRDEHERWFSQTLVSAERLVYIVMRDREPIGQVRFDRVTPEDAVVSAYVLEAHTGRGLGVDAIRRGAQAVFAQWPIESVIACVRSDNAAGASAFIKAGFVERAPGPHCPPAHRELVIVRQQEKS